MEIRCSERREGRNGWGRVKTDRGDKEIRDVRLEVSGDGGKQWSRRREQEEGD